MCGEQAWQRFVRLLEQIRELEGAALAAEDRALAAEVMAQRGALEARIDELASRGGHTGHPTLLGVFWNLRPPTTPIIPGHPELVCELPATLAALNAVAMLRGYAAARQRLPSLGRVAETNSVRLGSYFLSRAGVAAVDKLPLAPEHRDVMRARVHNAPLPDVLPADLTGWSANQITEALATYAGISCEQLEQRLYPGGSSSSGFLARGESLGEVILRDACTLAALGVSRHALADRIALVFDVAAYSSSRANRRAPSPEMISCGERLRAQLGPPLSDGRFEYPLSCDFTRFMGYQTDPFHSTFTTGSYPGGPLGASDFQIVNPFRAQPAVLRGPDLIISLIRRYGFFEGSVPYRVDPAHAAWVLGLTEALPYSG